MKSTSENLAKIGKVVLEELTDYLSQSQQGIGKTLTQMPAGELAKALDLDRLIKEGGLSSETAADWLKIYLENSMHMHHPGYIGHQVAVPHIGAGIADFIHGIVSNPMSIYEMGPSAAVIEKTIVNWMLQKIGWFNGDSLIDFHPHKKNGAGILTHGGSIANLTALLGARARAAPEAWDEGNPDNLVIFAPAVSHYSVARSASMMGLGKKAIVPIAVNDLEVMRPEALLPAFEKAKNEGKNIMAVIANACATATGLYDPIDEVGHFCNENDIWFHVDGAHGASALISEKEKHRLKGVQRADSLIWDTHKMLRTTTLCAGVLFKNPKDRAAVFQQKGSYIFHEKEQIGFDVLPYTLECTKEELGTKLFWVLASEGEQKLSQFIDNQIDTTRKSYNLINEHPHFECPYFPESNILCFQYTKFGTDNDFQLAIRNEYVKRGNFYTTSAEINGVRYLRIVVLNHLTTENTIQKLIKEIEIVAAELSLVKNR